MTGAALYATRIPKIRRNGILDKKSLGIGLVGSGFMGRTHALGLASVGRIFDLPLVPKLELLADATRPLAEAAAARFGFARATDDWQALVADPAVDVVDITAPNKLHAPIALAALALGKPVYCEKPLAPTAEDARVMAEAAERAGVVTQVGFNYICNPMLVLAREMIASGELGQVWGFRGIHAEDFMANRQTPWTWRLDPAGGAGAIADIGSHIIGMARFLLGPIAAVCADVETVIDRRPLPGQPDEMRAVAVDDQARLLLRFGNGCRGTLETSWLSSGRQMQLEFEVIGEKGALVFSQERFNELRYYKTEADRSRNGFRTILAGPEHAPYGAFCIAGGHQIGFNDLKVIEIRNFLSALAGGPKPFADFREGYEVQRVIDAALLSSKNEAWVRL
ncbi:Gfo/Idh/MocA family oxidoreductase [Acidisoma cellulosilytica]|uniref:Gfo/Idh/MocA family oxidoreductase n=1 Tax=Acidisoma cellulosilyticum TaxID=2802395 RepID=A0A963YZS5_9PROT|nr:Gfo/Idh/MocA family oxidoreductase [Acidisoma cellulosilyticum]